MYTDGVTEAENSRHEQYGEQRLNKYLASQSSPFIFDASTQAAHSALRDVPLAVDVLTLL